MKFLYCLPYTSENLFPLIWIQVRIVLDQFKQGGSEVGIDEKGFLLVAIDMHTQPLGACELRLDAFSCIVKRPEEPLDNEKIIIRPANDESDAPLWYGVSV